MSRETGLKSLERERESAIEKQETLEEISDTIEFYRMSESQM